MKFKNKIVFLLLFALAGCFTQYRMDFDLQKQALVSCDERISIKNVRIMEADSYDVVYQLRLKKDSKGSHILNLKGENDGYVTGPNDNLILKPNKEYIISSVFGDSSLEMRVFTNAESKIDSVTNKFSCLK